MTADEPCLTTVDNIAAVRGRFYRAVSVGYEGLALAGSVRAGRYSRPDQPTLYLSASVAGVEAAMTAHHLPGERRTVIAFDVDAADIFDLRSSQAFATICREAGDPFADWQTVFAAGGDPSSWRVRGWIEASGAKGLIDPSRKAPGLWHLVLFRWNVPGSAKVTCCVPT